MCDLLISAKTNELRSRGTDFRVLRMLFKELTGGARRHACQVLVSLALRREMSSFEIFKNKQPVWLQNPGRAMRYPSYVIASSIKDDNVVYVIETFDVQEGGYKIWYDVPHKWLSETESEHKQPMRAHSIADKVWPADPVNRVGPADPDSRKRAREAPAKCDGDTDDEGAGGSNSPVLKPQAGSGRELLPGALNEFTETQMNLDVELEQEPSPRGGEPSDDSLKQAVAPYVAPACKPGEEACTLPIVYSQTSED